MLRSTLRSFTVLAALAGAAMLLGACGPFGGGSDKGDVEDTIKEALTSEDEATVCEELVTENFLEENDSDEEDCKEEGEPADKVDISNVEVDGDEATADVELDGGDLDGADGEIELKKEDGDWKIDGFSEELISSVQEETTTPTDTDTTTSPDFGTTTPDVGSEEFLSTLEAALTSESGMSEEQAGCVIEELRFSLSEEELQGVIDELQAGGEPTELRDAGKECANVP